MDIDGIHIDIDGEQVAILSRLANGVIVLYCRTSYKMVDRICGGFLMWLLTLVLLVLLGLLGVAPWLKQRQPSAEAPLNQLIAIEGWIGLAGLIWGIFLLLRWVSAINVLQYAVGVMLLALVSALIIAALSLILSLPLIRALIGENSFTTSLSNFTAKLVPYRIGLGAACLALAIYTLLARLF